MKYIGKVLLSFLLVVSVLLGSNSFYANAQTGDNAGLSASDTETSFSNPINLSKGQYRIKLNFLNRKKGEYSPYSESTGYTLSTYGLLTVDNEKSTLKIKKYGYSGSYTSLFLKSEKAADIAAEVTDKNGKPRFPKFAADENWEDYSSQQRYFTELYSSNDFYDGTEGLLVEEDPERNAAYFTVPVDLDYGCLGYFSWNTAGYLESYYIVPEVKTAVSLDELEGAKQNETMGYQYTDDNPVMSAEGNGGNMKQNTRSTIEDYDVFNSKASIIKRDENGLTASFNINERFVGSKDKAVEKVMISPTDTSEAENPYRWGRTNRTYVQWSEIPIENGSFTLSFSEEEIIFGKELMVKRNVTGNNNCWYMTMIPLVEELKIIDITDEDSGVTFRYSNHFLAEDNVRLEAKKITEETEIPEGLKESYYDNEQIDTSTLELYKIMVTYADGTPIPQYMWARMSYMFLFPRSETMVGERRTVNLYQEQSGWADDDYIRSVTLEAEELEDSSIRPWVFSHMAEPSIDDLGIGKQDKEALYHPLSYLAQSRNYSTETYGIVFATQNTIDITNYENGVYEAKVSLLRQGSSYYSACAGLLDDDAIIALDEEKIHVYLNFTEEGEVAFGSGYYQGGLKAYDNTTNEYIEDSEVVYSYMCNSDGTLLDNTSYNALTEFPCILSTRITLDDRSLYGDESLTGHYRMGIISPVMAAMSGIAYADVEPIGVDLGIVSMKKVADLTDTEKLNSIPTYQKSVLMRSIQRGDLYLEGRADYAADAVTALESAVEAGRTYYYNDLKDVDNKSAEKKQSDRIKELSDAIENAITALDVPGNVDKSALKAAIGEAKALTEGEYTTLSWGALSKALSDAVVTNNRADVSQSVVDAEVKNLEAAMAALEKRSGDAVNPTTLSDGVYRIPAGLYKNSNVKSVSDAALDVAYLEVKDGQAKVTLSFVPWEDGAVNLTALSTLSNITSQVWNPYEIADCERTPVEPTETYAVGEESYPKEMVLDVTLPATLDSSDNYIWTETTVRSGETETTEYARLYLDYTGILNVTDAWNALETAESYMETDYTADSWKTFADALAALENALSGQADKASLQAAVDALADAQKALEKVSEPATEQPSTQSPQQTTQEPQTGQQTPAAGEPQTGSQQTAPVAGMVGEIFKVKGNTYRLTSNGASPAATLVKASKKKAKITVPASVKKNGVAVSVTAIGNNAFKNRKKVRTVVIGKNVQQIGKNAFAGCEKLRKITVKTKTLRMVGKNALRGISSRAVVKVPKKSLKRYQKLFRNKGQRRTVVIR